jgi:hypothetical protein
MRHRDVNSARLYIKNCNEMGHTIFQTFQPEIIIQVKTTRQLEEKQL